MTDGNNNMNSYASVLSATVAIGFNSLPVFAESGFPGDFNASVSGISIGQDAGAAREIVENMFEDDIALKEAKLVQAGTPKRSGDLLQESTVLHPVSQEKFTIGFRGSSVHEITDRSFRTSFAHYAGAASILLSSPVDRQRVEAIARRITYDTPLDPDAAVAKIVETYGEPHAQWGQQPMYLWGFKDGEPVRGNGDLSHATTLNNCSKPSQSPRFSKVEQGSDAIIPTPILRQHFEGNQNAFGVDHANLETCQAAARIELHLNADGLVHLISFVFIDKLGMRNNQEAFLAAVAEAQAATIQTPAGKTDVDDF
jgi:hypothetical protein